MKTAIALGTFDGVHIGHREVLRLPENYRKIAVTFEQSPKSVMTGVREEIMTLQKRLSVLCETGMDEILTLKFDYVRHMPPTDFLQFLDEKYAPDLISCGFNYRFGLKGGGNTETLAAFCRERATEIRCCESVSIDGSPVSSSRIRDCLRAGDIPAANRMLGSDFSYTAEVIAGDRRGRTIGFPTINQRYPETMVQLKPGVYRSTVTLNGKTYPAITNVGTRPTYRSDFIISETHIIGFSGDLYGKQITVTPRRFVRDEKKFSGIEELKRQIKSDLDS